MKGRVLMELTDVEAVEIDELMGAHMRNHNITNSPSAWSCNYECRIQSLKRAIEVTLSKREMSAKVNIYDNGMGCFITIPHNRHGLCDGGPAPQPTAEESNVHVLACTDAWRQGRLCIHEEE